jgi:hypothetical protein
VIEHVGRWNDMRAVADAVRRRVVGVDVSAEDIAVFADPITTDPGTDRGGQWASVISLAGHCRAGASTLKQIVKMSFSDQAI